ncbi:MAG: isochorismatase family protein [Armatimonadota bacterium]
MPSIKLTPAESVLLVIDLQESFLKIIHEAERVLTRSEFLCRASKIFDVPIVASEQYPSRMGGTDPRFDGLFDEVFGKMEFSAAANPEFMAALEKTGRRQVVIVGIETHICVSQTALDLLSKGYEVAVCPDAVSSSSQDRHKLGMERLRDAGVIPFHSEAVAYEWCHSADSPKFRELLAVVKQF